MGDTIMKFIDWYNFNFVENKVMNSQDDIYMKVLRKNSTRDEDVMIDVLMGIADAAKVFGDYEISGIEIRHDKEYIAIGASVYKE